MATEEKGFVGFVTAPVNQCGTLRTKIQITLAIKAEDDLKLGLGGLWGPAPRDRDQ